MSPAVGTAVPGAGTLPCVPWKPLAVPLSAAEEIPAGNRHLGSPIPGLHNIWGVLVRGWRRLWDPAEAPGAPSPAEVKFCCSWQRALHFKGRGRQENETISIISISGDSSLAKAASRGSVPRQAQLQNLLRRKQQNLAASLAGAAGKTAAPGGFLAPRWFWPGQFVPPA